MFKKLKEKVMNSIKYINEKLNIVYNTIKDESVIVAEFLKKYFKFVKYTVGGAILGIYYGAKDGYTIWKYGDDAILHIDDLPEDLDDLNVDTFEVVASTDTDAVETEEPV